MNNSEGQIIWQNISQTVKLLKSQAKKIAILCHLNPDGDTLGSALALNRLFTKMGHNCDVISPNDYPEFLKWMPGSDKIVILKHEHDRVVGILKNAEMIFAIDFNEIKRFRDLRDVFESSAAFRVLIDHHPAPTMKVDCMLSDPSASSTAELVYRFIHEAAFKNQMDAEISACLFTGIMTDTGCFSYNSSNRKTWETVADLLDYGINKDEIYSFVYDNYSEHRMRLLGFSLNEKLEVFPEFKTGIISISKADMKKYHFEVGDSEGFVNYPLSIKGVCFSALFLEKDDHIKLSFRSKGTFPVNEFSRDHFHGGGHKNASGGEAYCSLDEALKQFKDLLPRYRDKLNRDED
ncbi:MAG TPA: DHH family phosphoesterase [Bacteroidales bacterium]|nr:DHH family phosphoesterase [Bacteroidales bacterium]